MYTNKFNIYSGYWKPIPVSRALEYTGSVDCKLDVSLQFVMHKCCASDGKIAGRPVYPVNSGLLAKLRLCGSDVDEIEQIEFEMHSELPLN